MQNVLSEMSRKAIYGMLNVNRQLVQFVLLEKWAYTSLMAIFTAPSAIKQDKSY